eukprot:scaffold4566_cov118-Isochrysis_galbana.AAC.9
MSERPVTQRARKIQSIGAGLEGLVCSSTGRRPELTYRRPGRRLSRAALAARTSTGPSHSPEPWLSPAYMQRVSAGPGPGPYRCEHKRRRGLEAAWMRERHTPGVAHLLAPTNAGTPSEPSLVSTHRSARSKSSLFSSGRCQRDRCCPTVGPQSTWTSELNIAKLEEASSDTRSPHGSRKGDRR